MFSGLRKKWRASTRFRHTVGLCLVIVLIMGIGSGLLIYQTGNMIRKSAEERGLALTRAFAMTGATAVQNNLFLINEAIHKSFKDPDVLQIDVIDLDSMIVASKRPERIGTVLVNQDWVVRVKPEKEVLAYSQDVDGEPILVIAEPLFAQRQLVAWIRVVMSLTQARHEEWQTVLRMLLVTLALIAAGIVGVNIAQRHVSHVLRTLISQLRGALSALGASPSTGISEAMDTGKDQSIAHPGHGELEYLTDVATQTTELVKSQSASLRESEIKLRALTLSLEQKVKERTAELEVTRDHALLATQHKSEFLASMSHELRTPLNAVIGFSEVLLERMFGELNAKQEEYLQDILSSGGHLLGLINDILDLAKVEAGHTELELATVNLATTVEYTLTLVRERAMRHRIEVSCEIDRKLGECRADERKIKQILLNLLSNAIKFTPEDGRISVKARVQGDSAEISVSDTGVGIAEEDQPRVFEEFYQVKGDQTHKREGTGLGLALAKKLVELHGGTIRLESQVGRGSTFTFTLPLGQRADKVSVP